MITFRSSLESIPAHQPMHWHYKTCSPESFQMHELPLVTNAIPLYKSKPFVDIIIANIEAIDYPNIEIIISDRHQYDDAIDLLESHFKEDPRVVIYKSKDELTYAQHYNLLLTLGHGKYFRWMPHDDSYPRCCLKEKVGILESHPQYVLVNGPWHDLDSAGNVVLFRKPTKSKLGKWSFETAVFVAFGGYEGHAFKGLFRRDIVMNKKIFLFDTHRIISPERCWEYAMSLVGEFYCYDDFAYYKRYYPESTHKVWRRDWRPIDLLFAWMYKFKYLLLIDPRALRIMVFFILMMPLTIRHILSEKLPLSLWRRIKPFPGLRFKRLIRNFLSRI